MKAGESKLAHPQIVLACAGAAGSLATITVAEGAPYSHSGCRAPVTRVEPEDLARFEGEGGLEAPEPAMPSPRSIQCQ